MSYQPPHRTWDEARRGLPLASFARRGMALALDFLIAGLSFLAVGLSLGLLARRAGWIGASDDVMLRFTFFRNWYSVVWLVIYFGLLAWWGNGQTPGKRLCRIRVLSLAHERLGLWHSFERALGYGASALEAGFGFFQYFIRPDRRTVHDRIAETIVVETPKKSRQETR